MIDVCMIGCKGRRDGGRQDEVDDIYMIDVCMCI